MSNGNKHIYYETVRTGKLNDIEARHKGFETITDVIKEWKCRVDSLERSKFLEDNTLAKKVESCGDEKSCNSPSCPFCVHQYRKWFFAELSEISRNYSDLQFHTILFYDEIMTDEELLNFDPLKLKNRLRKQLERAGFKNPVFGFLELDRHTEIGKWLPHFHLVVMNNRRGINNLRRYYKKQKRLNGMKTVSRPFHAINIRTKAGAFSYICKLTSFRIEAWSSRCGHRKTLKGRLRPKQFRLSLYKNDEIGFSGFLFLYGVRRIGSKLVVNEK